MTVESRALPYWKGYFEGGEYSHYQHDRNLIQENFARRKHTIEKYMQHGNLLEIGSAYGYSLQLMREAARRRAPC
jgi:hypothetical protein